MSIFKRSRILSDSPKSPELQFPDEPDLIRRCQRGDLVAFDVLFGRYFQLISILCLRLLGDEDLAKDAVQEAFTKAWRNITAFKGRSQFSTWLYSIAMNLCIDRLRKLKREELLTGLPESTLADLANSRPLTANPLGHREQENVTRRIILQEAFQRLPEIQRMVVTMRIFNELSEKEIGERLNVSERTVRKHLGRGLERLGTILNVEGC